MKLTPSVAWVIPILLVSVSLLAQAHRLRLTLRRIWTTDIACGWNVRRAQYEAGSCDTSRLACVGPRRTVGDLLANERNHPAGEPLIIAQVQGIENLFCVPRRYR